MGVAELAFRTVSGRHISIGGRKEISGRIVHTNGHEGEEDEAKGRWGWVMVARSANHSHPLSGKKGVYSSRQQQ